MDKPEFRLGFPEEVVLGKGGDSYFYACVPDPNQPKILAAVWWLDETRRRAALFRDPIRKPGDDLNSSFNRKTSDSLVAAIGDYVLVTDELEAQLAIFHLIQNVGRNDGAN